MILFFFESSVRKVKAESLSVFVFLLLFLVGRVRIVSALLGRKEGNSLGLFGTSSQEPITGLEHPVIRHEHASVRYAS